MNKIINDGSKYRQQTADSLETLRNRLKKKELILTRMKFTSKARRGKVLLAKNQTVKLAELYDFYGKETAENLIRIGYFRLLNIKITRKE